MSVIITGLPKALLLHALWNASLVRPESYIPMMFTAGIQNYHFSMGLAENVVKYGYIDFTWGQFDVRCIMTDISGDIADSSNYDNICVKRPGRFQEIVDYMVDRILNSLSDQGEIDRNNNIQKALMIYKKHQNRALVDNCLMEMLKGRRMPMIDTLFFYLVCRYDL
jgi:hypothetical protein